MGERDWPALHNVYKFKTQKILIYFNEI